MRLIPAYAFLLLSMQAMGQIFTTETGDDSPGELLTDFDQIPVFPGDVPMLFGFFENNVFAPMPARSEQDVSFTEDNRAFYEHLVVLAFDLNQYGEISSRRIQYSNNLLMDRTWQRALEQMPLWAPAIIYGEPTDVQVFLPLRYIIVDNQIQVLGWGEWFYESSGENFWFKLVLAALVVGTFAVLFFNLL
jgi:hypothetical protein